MLLETAERVAPVELPGADDLQYVHFRAQLGRKGIEGRGEAHDVDGGFVEHAFAGRAQDANVVDAAVGVQRHHYAQGAVDALRGRLRRVVGIADGFDALAPVVEVERIVGFLRRGGGDRVAARALRVFLAAQVELRAQAGQRVVRICLRGATHVGR